MKEAIVLVGGRGTRLRSVVSDRPKVLAEVAGKPFLDYILEYLSHYQISKVILSVCYKKELIQERYQNRFHTITIGYCTEEEPLGTGGAIQKALLQCTSETVFVLNGDSILLAPLKKIWDFHRETGAAATLAVREVPDGSRYGSVLFDTEGRIQRFAEKEQVGPAFINGGVYCVQRAAIQHTCAKLIPPFSIESDVFPKMAQGHADIRAFPVEAFFIDIGIPESLEEAQAALPAHFSTREPAGDVS